jgi:hypothetical protein
MAKLKGDSASTAGDPHGVEQSRGDQAPSRHAGFWRVIGPIGRRALVTGIGAILSFSCGVGVATAFRLPQDMGQAVQPDPMTVQDELPSAPSVRAFALANPPPYPAAMQTATDDVPPPHATPDPTLTTDDQQSDQTSSLDNDQERADPSATAIAPQPAPESTRSPAN